MGTIPLALFTLLLFIIQETRSKTPIRFLALVPWKDELERPHSGWDAGPDMIAAGRVAVNEINSHPYLLKDYELQMIEGRHEACGLTEANIGIKDLVRFSFSPPNRTVAAVLGLFCSTSAQIIAPIAGTGDLIQLSAANSAIFTSARERFPHLWRILVSGNVYADTVIALMDHFNWTRIGVVQDFETIYHSGIAETFLSLITRNRTDLDLVYHGGLVQTREGLINNTLDNIKAKGARIVFLQTTGPQTSKFLCSAAQRGMVYPDYLWIITDFFLSGLVEELEDLTNCNKNDLLKGANGSLVGFFELESANSSVILVSGEPFSEYQRKYLLELQQTRLDHYDTGEVRGDVLYAGLLYDQVWALAMAINDSLPHFTAANLSIGNYRFNEPTGTAFLEESLSKVDFIGATGRIKFSQQREVENPVNLYQICIDLSLNDTDINLSLNDADILFGFYDPINNTIVSYTPIHVPSDNIVTNVIYLPAYGTVILYLATIAVIGFVTSILIFFIYNRERPQIKATSPIFSLIMFIGCYCLCIMCLVSITYISFPLPNRFFQFLCNIQSILLLNGLSLIFVTLFIKLLRIHKIFNNKAMQNLGWIWNGSFLTTMVITITIIPNILLILWIGIDRLKPDSRSVNVTSKPLIHTDVFYTCNCKYLPVWYGLGGVYLAFILILVVLLAARTRHIKHSNFKDTKKVNVFIFLFTLILFISISLLFTFIQINLIIAGQVIFISGLLFMVCLCQVMLFLPKIITFKRKNTKRYTITSGLFALFNS